MIRADAQINLENLINMQRAIHEGMLEGLAISGKYIVDLASQLAPRDSGELSLSGESHLEDDVLIISFGNNLPDERAAAQEYGTVFMPAQPYLGPAVKNIDIIEEVAKAIRSKLI